MAARPQASGEQSWSPAALLPLPFLLHSHSKLPGSKSAWAAPQPCWWPTTQQCWGPPRAAGAVVPFGDTALAATRIRHCCVPGPGEPGQATNGARGTECSTPAVSLPRGLRAWHGWVTLHPALGGQPAVGWHGSQGRESAASPWNLLEGISKPLPWSGARCSLVFAAGCRVEATQPRQ